MQTESHLRNPATPANRSALTLIEVLCLVTLAITLLVVIMPMVGRTPGAGRITVAHTQITMFQRQLETFRDDTGFYPTDLQGLVHQPPGATNWHGPYADDIPKDPWGREYVYKIPGEHTSLGYPYDLFSLGPTSGTYDEERVIANWNDPGLKP